MSNALKKTMVFLGLTEDDGLEYEEVESAESSTPERASSQAQPTKSNAHVTPLRRVTPTAPVKPQAMSEILTVRPVAYSDVREISENYRQGIPVIVNIARMDDAEAMRLYDFLLGLSVGLDGTFKRIAKKVYVLSPADVAISGEEEAQERQDSFFVTPSA